MKPLPLLLLVLLVGCGTRSNQTTQIEADQAKDEAFIATHGITAESIAAKQGWSIEATKAQMEFMKLRERNSPVPVGTWKIVEDGGRQFGKSYIAGLVGFATTSGDPEIKKTGIDWSRQLMNQTDDIYAVSLGYLAHVRSGQKDAAEWSQKLQARSEEQKRLILVDEESLRKRGILR